MATKSVIIGRTLAALGIVLIIPGAGFFIGLLFGLFRTFPWEVKYAAAVALLVGNTIRWFGNSLAAGTLKHEIKETMKYEASETLRLRSSLSPVTAVLVVIGFTIIAGFLVWWVLSQNAT